METKEADAIVRFLNFAKQTMTQDNFMLLCQKIEKENDDMTDELQQYIYCSAFDMWQEQLEEMKRS
ncbi:hypothetical protein FC65_GL000882 [Ligilactobacillus acidipiscis DSM 15836]|uniref:Uncharacterized protein n=1 Tax=Ligilactobacillus acidipiscis DSM 15836 TaxID=1423716 RepID=A0ABR5PQ63_9LACO|nr:hypothetical protein [Ligilactobacillus acidipiscis]KRM31972.1 hypothetical protein FC65_GL000882 [Ligilactobacillus acidipiscis DSM 15836]GAW63091.1 hypothetical protein Lacidipiscis_00273 [Ligilactobacillus acidipiscis]GEN19685.1 hypothetical protein LAC02_29660 [Ligilactobacillus acidipiscis]